MHKHRNYLASCLSQK